MNIGNIDAVKAALESFQKLVDAREKALDEYRNEDGEVNEYEYRGYDETRTDYALDLEEAGEHLAAAVAEALGLKEDS
ncbi:hypothetical protein AVV38_gp24 [Mycobacterium phage Piro94]|uniref:Uncharacterized protein n=1 Tax=Mycobacterium phage Piro94 TaxID=1527520 RepID=A0A076YKP4_9CAUD|nr:hypothetical protein AVV38_gp24 [Mycobacterium phage Piro94]AIK67795.1 hypothetical protein PBI_PIRO94_79 [Mycobacterium phage Piro94]ASZ72870.1 hypothetical protein SEA_DRAKE55_81 [Mycobacterium phage Drake55]